MGKRKGLFSVFTLDKCLRGTAFVVKEHSTPGMWYALTAYHVVSEQMASSDLIYLEDEEKEVLKASVVYPEKVDRQHRSFSQDFAALSFASDISYEKYQLIDYIVQDTCYVQGAIPHYKTKFTTLLGKTMGIQKLLIEREDVLQIQLKLTQLFDEENNPIPEQEVICGISGAPVLINKNETAYCIGVFANIADDMQGSMQYAVPAKEIIEKIFPEDKISHSITKPLKTQNILGDAALIELIIGDMDEFEFSNEDMELNAWNKLSDSFYKGYCVDEFLDNIIQGAEFRDFNPEVQYALYYFNSRLLLKRGKIKRAFEIFQIISNNIKAVAGNTGRKLLTLIECRKIIEAPIKDSSSKLRAIRSLEDIIEGISNSSDIYVTNELASTYGKGLTNFFAIHTNLTREDKENIIRIYQEQKNLVTLNPKSLKKQAVVTTLLEYFLSLWEIHSEFDNQFLKKAICKGFEHSKNRKNAIFYVTTLITYAILYMSLNNNESAIKTLFLTVLLMKKEGIKSEHEGIKQLILCMRIKFPSLYVAYTEFYKYGKNIVNVQNNAMIGIDLNNEKWYDIVDMTEYIYYTYYSNNEKIFDVSFDKIEIFL